MHNRLIGKLTRAKGDTETADHTGSTSPMVKMVAVHRKDGEIATFVKSYSVESKKDEPADSSSDELLPGMGKGDGDTGSNGWMKQTIARLNGVGTRQNSVHNDHDVSPVAQQELTESMGIVQQKVQKLEMEHLRKMQQHSEFLTIVGNHDIPDIVDKHFCDVPSACSSIITASLSHESSTSEYLDPLPSPGPAVGLKDVERIITNTIEVKLQELKEIHELEIQKMLGEHEQHFQKTLEGLVDQMNKRIDDEHAKLESMFNKNLQDKVSSDDLDERIQHGHRVLKEEIQTSLSGEIDAAVSNKIVGIHEKMDQYSDQMTQNVERKVNDLVIRISDTEKRIRETIDLSMDNVDSLVDQRIQHALCNLTGDVESMKGDIRDIGSRSKKTEGVIKGIATNVETLKSEVSRFDMKIEQQSNAIVEKVTHNVDKRLDDLSLENDINIAIAKMDRLCGDFERRVPAMVSDECDGKLGIMVTDMVDKSSQDFFRAFENHVQSIKGGLLKQIIHMVDAKLRALVEPRTDEEASIKSAFCKSLETSIMGSVVKEIESATGRINTSVSEVQDNMEHIKSRMVVQESSPICSDDTAVGTEQMTVVDQKLKELSTVSEEVDRKISVLTKTMEECKTCMADVAESTRLLNEDATLIVSQVRKAVSASVQQLDMALKNAESTIESHMELLAAGIKESTCILNAMKSMKETSSRSVRTVPPHVGPDYQEPHIMGARHLGFDPSADGRLSTPTALSTQPCTVRDERQVNMRPNMFCGLPVPRMRSETPTSYYPVTPVNLPSSGLPTDRIVVQGDSPGSDPSKRVEVKYVDMNGQRIKVTQEHVTLSEMASRPPLGVQGTHYPQNATNSQPQMYY